MHVLSIDEATTDTRLHIDEVELDDTSNKTPVFLVDIRASTLFGGQFQINT